MQRWPSSTIPRGSHPPPARRALHTQGDTVSPGKRGALSPGLTGTPRPRTNVTPDVEDSQHFHREGHHRRADPGPAGQSAGSGTYTAWAVLQGERADVILVKPSFFITSLIAQNASNPPPVITKNYFNLSARPLSLRMTTSFPSSFSRSSPEPRGKRSQTSSGWEEPSDDWQLRSRELP